MGNNADAQLVKVCFICNKVFKLAPSGSSGLVQAKANKTFVRHMQIQHGLNEKGERLVDCPVCNKWFFNRQQMERHMRTHQVWIRDEALAANNNTNNNNNNISNSTVSSGGSLLPEFKDKHSILYCHECIECKTFFKSLKVLTKHKQEAHGLKPVFRCMCHTQNETLCPVQYDIEHIDEFFEHAKVHSQKNITCSKCQAQFTSKNALRNHMKNVHYKISTSVRKRPAKSTTSTTMATTLQRKNNGSRGVKLNATSTLISLGGLNGLTGYGNMASMSTYQHVDVGTGKLSKQQKQQYQQQQMLQFQQQQQQHTDSHQNKPINKFMTKKF